MPEIQMMNDIRICFIGDSFVNGTGDPQKLGWTGRVARESESHLKQITYYNLGIRRDTSENILSRWYHEAKIRLPNNAQPLVVFSFGVNDTVIENGNLRVSHQQSIGNSRELLTQAQRNYPVKMIGPPPIDDPAQNIRIEQLDHALKQLCTELNVPYLSIFPKLLDNPLWQQEVASNDGAHPRAAGYQLIADQVLAWSQWQL